MSLIDKNSIKSFLGGKSFLTGIEDADGHEAAVAQAENIVYQKTLVPIPSEIATAIPLLQFCAHCIYIYIVSTRQKLSEDEMKQRKQLYDDGMAMLNEIQNGTLPLYSAGAVVTTSSQTSLFHVTNCNRSERL